MPIWTGLPVLGRSGSGSSISDAGSGVHPESCVSQDGFPRRVERERSPWRIGRRASIFPPDQWPETSGDLRRSNRTLRRRGVYKI